MNFGSRGIVPTLINRGPAVVYSAATLGLCWLLMQAVHETGHVVGAWLTGGTVTKLVLHPLAISRTDVVPNPSPLIEIWAGPVGGVLIPVGLWIVLGRPIRSLNAWLRFFAGFCLIANGLYLGAGLFDPVGDAADLIRHGTQPWHLAGFGAVTVPVGFLLWHKLGPEFGWGPHGKPISWSTAGEAVGTLMAIVILELWLSPSV